MADSGSPVRIEHLRGRVVRRVVGGGSKSEHEAVCVETSRGSFVLRRKGGPSYGDATLERYLGKTVSCSGVILNRTILCHRIREVRGSRESD